MNTAMTQSNLYLTNDNYTNNVEYLTINKDITNYRTRLYIQVTQNGEIYYSALNAKVAINYDSPQQTISLHSIELEEESPNQHLVIQSKINDLLNFQGSNIVYNQNASSNNDFYSILLRNLNRQESIKSFLVPNLYLTVEQQEQGLRKGYGVVCQSTKSKSVSFDQNTLHRELNNRGINIANDMYSSAIQQDSKTYRRDGNPSSIYFSCEEKINDTIQLYISIGLEEENLDRHRNLINRLYSIFKPGFSACW